MDTRGSSLQSRGLRDLHCLHHGLFQTSTDRAQLRAAVYQVFGGQPWRGCCSDKLLETLLEAGQRSYLKQQLYWDFQLLDSDHDGYLSVRDAELLLAQVPHAHATGEAWQDFLRTRGPGVAWRDIEDWLFRSIQLPVDEPRTGRRRGLHNELGTSAGSSTSLYQWGVRSRTEQPLERWDSGGVATLLGEEPSGVLAALERKYRVLQRKLCAEMLQVHYGQPAWASLPQNVKEDKLSELELLVDCGLRKGSVLSLACLPGALLSIRSRVQKLESDRSVQRLSPSAVEGTAAQALEELRRRRQVETAALLSQQHLLVGSSPEASRRLLHLHALTALVQQEASFQAALLITELFQGERFWDAEPVVPEACHQELAQLRLAAGHGLEPAWREAKTMPGRSMTQVLLDRLLLQHERDRTCLVQILLTLAGTETPHQEAHGGKQLILPGAGCREDTSPALQDAIAQMLKLAQKRLEVARRVEVTWQDCAVAVLVDLQQAQEEELQQTIEDLVGIVSGREGESGPTLYEKLLARLQEPLLMSLIRHLQPVSPQEKHRQESLKLGPGTSAQELSPGEMEGSTATKMLQREDGPNASQEQNKMESQGPLLKKLKTSEHQDGDSEVCQNLAAPQVGQNLTEDQEIQKSLDTFLLQAKSKSWGPPEFVRPQVLLPKELRQPEIPQGEPQASHDLGGQCKEQALDPQSLNYSKCISNRDIRSDAGRKATDIQPHISPKGQEQVGPGGAESHMKQATESSSCQASYQEQKDPEFSQLQEALLTKSKSLDPQELSRPWSNEHCGPLPREEAISGLQDCKFPQDCQPEKCKETKAQETSQHHKCPGSEQTPELLQREPETSTMAKRQDRQEKIPVSCPQEQMKTKACQTDPELFHAQDKKQRDLSRPHATKQCKKAKKEPEIQMPRKTRSLKSKEMSRSQGMIPMENIHTQGMPEGRPQGFLQGKLEHCQVTKQGCQPPEKKSLGTIQEQREPGLPQNHPHHEIRERKAKSLDLRRPPAFQSQELKVPCKQGSTQIRSGALEPQGQGQLEDFQSQKQKEKPQSHRLEELQEEGEAQQGQEIMGPQTTKARREFPPEEKTCTELPQSQEAQMKKPKPLELRESPKRKDMETTEDWENVPQRQKGVLQIQEYGRPESPPLLWRVLWQKAKSFDVGKPYVFPIQKLKKLEAALAQGMPPKMKGSAMAQPQMGLQIHKPQEDQRPESPPLLWRILWQKSKSFELRKSCAFETRELRGSLIVQVQGGPEAHKPQEPTNLREAALLTQRTRKGERPQAQGTPQIKTQALEEIPPLKDARADVQERRDAQALQSETLPTQRMSGKDQHPQESRYSETPPLLWRVLEMKAKSFELRKPGLRAIQRQRRNLDPIFLAPQERKRLEMIKQQENPHVGPESHKHGGPKICYPLEVRDPEVGKGPQRNSTITQSGKILPQGLGAPQMEMHLERSSPETPPLMWWVLEMGRQGMPHRNLKEVESALLQESGQRQMDPQHTPPEKASRPQEKVTGSCDSYKACLSQVPQPQEEGRPENPHPTKAQGVPQSNPEGFGCLDLLEGEKDKIANCPAQETLGDNKTDSLLSPGKSKSLDPRELRPPKPPELRELESLGGQGEPQGRPKALPVQEDSQMKLRKGQPPKDLQALKAQKRGDLGGFQTQSTQTLQSQGGGAEIPPPLRSTLHLPAAELMRPHVLPTQELVVLHLQGTLQMDPEALKFHRHTDPKPLCLQQHYEAGSEFQTEEKPSEIKSILPKNPQNRFVEETTQLQAALLGNSTSFGPQELSKPGSFQIQEKQTQAPGCPQAPEDQALKGLETFAPQVMVANPLQDTKVLTTQPESPVKRESSNKEISQPQEKTEEKEPGAPDSQGYTQIEVYQPQEKKETEVLHPPGAPQMEHTPLSFGPTDPRHIHDLQLEEAPPHQAETLEVMEHGTPSTWLSPGYSELWEFWRTLGKSKSLDLKELRALQLESLGEFAFSRLQDTSRTKIWPPQRKPQDDPTALHSKFLQLHELLLKNQEAPQSQERKACEIQRPQMVGLDPLQAQEPLRSQGDVLSSQEVEEVQIFCPKICGATEAGEEPLQAPRSEERQPGGAVEPQGLMEPQPHTPQGKRDTESPALLKGLLQKSKTLGPETLTRRDVFEAQDVRKTESPPRQGTPKTQLRGPESHNIRELSMEHQEMPNDVEGPLEPPIAEKTEFRREASTVETGTTKAQEPLPVNCDIPPGQGSAQPTAPEWPQDVPLHEEPQFGLPLHQGLGRQYNELGTLGPQEQKDQEAVDPQGARELFESEGQGAVEPQVALDPQFPQHPEWQRTRSYQPPLVEQKTSEASETQQEGNQGPCQSPGILKEESGSRASPKLKPPQISQLQECLPETSLRPVARVSHALHSQEFRDPAIYCPQESPEVGWEPLEAKGKGVQTDFGPSALHEQHALEVQGTLRWKSKSLDPQELSRTWDLQVFRGAEGLLVQHREVRGLDQETAEVRQPLAATAFSPPSPGRYEEELTWEPAALSVGISRESSTCAAQPGRRPELLQHSPEEDMPAEGEGATDLTSADSHAARAWKLPSPRPPRREKAFIWLSRQEQEEALRQLAELRAEGELRQRRDKERQILRFQERLSIAKHRKSEDDLLGSSPAELPPTEHQGQDQAGQKTAVKRHLEKVKRERTYVMQSKRERNTLRFKELLDPLVAPGEESPEPGQPGDE